MSTLIAAMIPPFIRACALLALGVTALPAADHVKLTRLNDRVRVEINGTPFTEYIFEGASRPYCYPILAADGTPLTRDFPMKKTEGEETDHPWHRSLFFEHSVVNDVDFWNEGNGDKGKSPDAKGNTVQDSIVELASGTVGVLRTRNNWVAPGNRVICTDERTLRFGQDGESRYIDYEVTVHALSDVPLHFGDNKDGTMATRIAQWMTMPHKKKEVEVGGTGQIVTANGDRDADAWGKRADWCDYHASHNGKTYGIAIFDHPGNLRHPTWWMARDYGLFGANPFGMHDFEKKPNEPHLGDYTIPAGGSLTLKYRLYFHYGDEKEARLAEKYSAYVNAK